MSVSLAKYGTLLTDIHFVWSVTSAKRTNDPVKLNVTSFFKSKNYFILFLILNTCECLICQFYQ